MSRPRMDEAERGLTARAAMTPAAAKERRTAVAVGLPNGESAQLFIERLKQVLPSVSIACMNTFERLMHTAENEHPELIVVDDRILGGGTLAESIEPLATIAPVLVVARYERHGEIGRLVAAGRADFVPRSGDWERFAASLIERRLRSVEARTGDDGGKAEGPDDDMGEIFRHEINNPLTGILGNAELLLAHSEKFPAAETQRIRTVVELAVRLRETVRRISDRWGKARDS